MRHVAASCAKTGPSLGGYVSAAVLMDDSAVSSDRADIRSEWCVFPLEICDRFLCRLVSVHEHLPNPPNVTAYLTNFLT